MQNYYEPTTKNRYTTSQLERRGLLHPSVELKAIGIYPLVIEKPQYDLRYQQITNERVEGDSDSEFKIVWDVEYLPLEQVKQAKESEITKAHDVFLKSQFSEYSEMERGTWGEQRKEANDLLRNAQASAPLVRSIAIARGLDVLDLARRIQKKAASWSKLVGHITGQRQALQDKVTEANLPETVIGIHVGYLMPDGKIG